MVRFCKLTDARILAEVHHFHAVEKIQCSVEVDNYPLEVVRAQFVHIVIWSFPFYSRSWNSFSNTA